MSILPLIIAVPLLAGFILPLIPKAWRRVADAAAWAVAAGLLALAIAAYAVPDSAYHMGGWVPPVGINLVLDGLSRLMLLLIASVSFAVIVYCPAYMDRFTAKNRFYALFYIMVAGMNGVVLTGDLFNLFVFLEIASIASYALVAFGGEKDELEASFRYLVLGSISSYFLLLGVALLYAKLGSVNMAHLSQKIAAAGGLAGFAQPVGGLALLIFAVVLFICGLGLKAALVPFHAWLPDAHPSAPTPISAMLSGLLIKAIGVYALVRVLFTVIGFTPEISNVLMTLGAASMVFGVFMAVGQWDFKRLLAYHSISQMGYVVLSIGLGTPLGVAAGLFHLVNHALFKSLLFLGAGAVEYRTGTRQLDQMGGLAKRMPATAANSFVASMSIAGVPPFNGFFSKLLIILACCEAGRWGFAACAVIVSILTLASFMKVQKYAFFGPLKEKWQQVREVPATMVISMSLLAILCLATSALFLPGPRRFFLERAQASVREPEKYRKLVLPGATEKAADRAEVK